MLCTLPSAANVKAGNLSTGQNVQSVKAPEKDANTEKLRLKFLKM